MAGSLPNPLKGQSLWHIRVNGDRVVFVERIELGRRIRDVEQFGAYKIAVWLDGNDLAIFELSRRKDQVSEVRDVVAAAHGATMADRVMTVLASCNECHSYQAGVHESAPSLNGMVGCGIADTDYEGYSAALSGMSGIWTPERLEAFLTDTENFAPGTAMPASALADETDVELIEATIRALSELRVLD